MIDAYRRNLQRAYLDLVNTKVNANGAGGEERPLYRAELKSLSASLAAAIAKTADRETKAHLEDSRNQIAKILDPKYAPAAANGGTVVRIGIDGIDPLWGIPDPSGVCWPDYAIHPN